MTFTIGITSAVTDAGGTASCTITGRVPLDPGSGYQISVAETDSYLPGTGTGEITVR